MSTVKYLSLFSGIGAFEKGLVNNNIDYELVNFSEINKYAIESYCAIHDVDKNKNLGDIKLIDYGSIPDFDLMTYGFPCQTFSIAGKREGFNNEEKGNLFFYSMKIVKEKKPKIMIAENVKGLLSHDRGDTFKTILKILNQLGYNNYYKVLKSSNFNVPHARERVFLISIRRDIDNGKLKISEGTPTDKTVKYYIDFETEDRYVKPSLQQFFDRKYFKLYKQKNGLKKLFDGVRQGYMKSSYSQNRIYSIDGYCPTLTTGRDAPNFYEIGGVLTAKERILLQGFSINDYDRIKNHVSETQICKLAGNSITVDVISSVINDLILADLII